MAYDSEMVDETLWKELISMNPKLAEEDEREKKIINLRDYSKQGEKNDKSGIR